MARNMTEEEMKVKNIEIREKIQEEILPSPTLEDTSTANIKEEEIIEPNQGKILEYNINIKIPCIELEFWIY